jgi:hypothetical protein
MMLAACGTSDSAKGKIDAGINLPNLPAHLKRACEDPPVKAGDDARRALGRTRVSLAECRRRHGGTVEFYDDTKRQFSRRSK